MESHKIIEKFRFDGALIDNGSEFRNLYKLEMNEADGYYICRIFYCDPYK